MDFVLQTALTALFSFAALFVITKLIGYRQLAQMSTFDYINGITIGSIGAEMAIAEGQEFWEWAIALAIYGVATWLLAVLSDHSVKARRMVNGRAIVLLDKGKLYDKNFRRAHMDIHEFQMECRSNGYFDLSQIQTAVLESNGKVSILPVSRARPATPEDLALAVQQENMCANVIIDGKIMKKNLNNMGFDIEWLKKQLQKQRKTKLSNIFLATCSSDGMLTVFERADKEHRDILE
ncbi:MAG: DUF421 domain-containing protein [Eubacteriales bacterium]|nr:DUF421 domain-containing protein [Eubacteriales bacterium]